ncbi:restriction endonuclease subunit S [uncultured Martelella sp.]|uniref:restriction endonuclease subunit S n=1 Tax=uncultured Martelella sp. TaxID=392331 RepID=UPI0029C6288D|nr:restriction endonuclease subunit S [uncultured Martelella sp.]
MSREVPEGWNLLPLTDLANYINGRAFKPEDWVSSGLPIIRIANMTNLDAAFNFYEGKDIDDGHMIQDGDILFSWSATLSIQKWTRGAGVLNQHIFKVVPTGAVQPDWLLYVLQNEVERLADQSHGSTMKHIKKGVLKTHHVGVPPLHEQRRIAEILSSVDEAIAATRAVIKQTRKVKQGVLERLLTKGIGHTRSKQTEIGDIPEGWRVAELSTLLESCTYGLNTSMESTPVGTPILRMGNIQDSEVSLAGLKYAVLDEVTKEKYSILRGDLLFNRTNSRELVGKIAIVREDLNASFASYLIRLRANCFNDPFFIHCVLSSLRYQRLLRSIATPGASQANINATKLGNIVLPVPPVEEQREITKSMDALMAAENASLKSLNELEVTKSALMSDLLTGRKRVTDALPMAAE